jgi:DNA-binding response OmpR family regulator
MPAFPPVPAAGPTVLVVDDERKIVDIVRAYLEREGFRVVTAADGESALRQVRQEQPALVVLDVMLPALSGWDVCRRIRAHSDVPIIMLTARDDLTDTVLGLELGADDYVTKPFEPRELVARVRAHLRRSRTPDVADRWGRPGPRDPRAGAAGPITWGRVLVDPEQREVRCGPASDPLPLTRSEFDLLLTLAAHPGRVFTRLQLLEAIQGDAYEGYERTIDSHVKNLRQKIEPDPHAPRYILTVYGVGYKAAPEPLARDQGAS